jgi:hypothetical protein
MTAHLLEPSACLSCGKISDAVTNPLDDDGPEPGNITICWYCGHIMAFADDLTFRELTSKEAYEIAGDKVLIRLQKARADYFREQ